MTDAEGSSIDSVHTDVELVSDGKYRFSLIPDVERMSFDDRELPVRLSFDLRQSTYDESSEYGETHEDYYEGYYTTVYSEPQITEGVYYLKNYSSGKYLECNGTGLNSGTTLSQSAKSEGSRNQLFKITYIMDYGTDHYYNIRLMTNSSLGLYAPATALSNWILEEYTGDEIDGVTAVTMPTAVYTGRNYALKVCMYSSRIGVNGPVTYSVSSTSYTSTDKATVNTSTGVLTTLYSGQVKVGVTYQGAPWVWYWTVRIAMYYGCRDYLEISSRNDPLCSQMNCLGYAFNITNCTNISLWDNQYVYYMALRVAEPDDLLEIALSNLSVFLDDAIGENNWECVTNQGGINATLSDNQWLVAMRVGLHSEGDINTYEFADYHFWYRTSSEDTVPVATDKEDNTSVPEESTVDNITTDAVAVDIDNPKLSDLFDLTKEHFESESLIQSIAVTSEWYELEWKQWQTSFKDAIDLLGKPHGFRPGHPDTLVWVTDTGKTFGIRFYVPQASTESFINTYDQLMHSYAAWCHPVNCDIEFPDESYLINLPIVPQDSGTSDSIGLWQDIFLI